MHFITRCSKLNDRPDGSRCFGEFDGHMSGAMVCHSAMLCMRPEFMTSMSCDSVYCMCGAAWSSRWLMTLLTNGERACVRASGGHFEHIFWLSICFLFTRWTLPCLTQHVILKYCIITVWNVMFSFSLSSVSTLFRWGVNFCHVRVKHSFLLTTVLKI